MGITRRTVLASTGLTVLTAGCGHSKPAAPAAPRNLTTLTGFGLLGQDAYLYAAHRNGSFENEGLRASIKPGSGTVNNLRLLAAGRVDFATVDLTGAIQAYEKNMRGWKAIAAIYQRSVSCIIARADTGISTPRDLAGKKIAYQPGGVNHTLFPTYARLCGLDHTTVRWLAVEPAQQRVALAAGRVDAITETVIGKAGTQAVAHTPLVVLPYSEVLTDLYGNVIVTRTERLDNDANLVAHYRTAALAGLRYAIDHPDQAGAIFHQYQPAYPAGTAAAETRLMNPYVHPIGGDPLGSIDPVRVVRTIALLKGSGTTTSDIDPEEIVAFALARPRPATSA